MQNKKSDPPITRSEFLKETGLIRKEMATKDNLNKFATKDDLNKFATKDDLNKLAVEIVKTQSELKKVEERIEIKMSAETNKVLGAIDAFAQKAENYDRKAVFHGNRIEEHEVRITQLEKTISKS